MHPGGKGGCLRGEECATVKIFSVIYLGPEGENEGTSVSRDGSGKSWPPALSVDTVICALEAKNFEATVNTRLVSSQ